jgi:hypothetical protein
VTEEELVIRCVGPPWAFDFFRGSLSGCHRTDWSSRFYPRWNISNLLCNRASHVYMTEFISLARPSITFSLTGNSGKIIEKCISTVKPARCTIFEFTEYHSKFRTVFPSIIRSSRLYIQRQAYVTYRLVDCLLAGTRWNYHERQIWEMYVYSNIQISPLQHTNRCASIEAAPPPLLCSSHATTTWHYTGNFTTHNVAQCFNTLHCSLTN